MVATGRAYLADEPARFEYREEDDTVAVVYSCGGAPITLVQSAEMFLASARNADAVRVAIARRRGMA